LSSEIKNALDEFQGTVEPYALQLGYEHYSADEVLQKLLPSGVDVPGSFEIVGHIAHLNLREEQEPFKLTIGQVILDVLLVRVICFYFDRKTQP